jgi:triosephosphate isomerase
MAPIPLIVGNWKMYGLREAGIALVEEIIAYMKQHASTCEVVVCPPATLTSIIYDVLKSSPIVLGGQDCHELAHGPYTGNISPEALRELGCRYVIVGHSERRKFHAEDNEMVSFKAKGAIKHGLIPIICIGESLQEREAGEEEAVIEKQLRESLPKDANPTQYVLAYEPVWAIGTGKNADMQQISAMHHYIKSKWRDGAAPRLLYGGSVKASNATNILTVDGVDGLLVGGASLQADDFCAIIQAASDRVVKAA